MEPKALECPVRNRSGQARRVGEDLLCLAVDEFVQFQRHLLHNLDLESFERRQPARVIRQQANSSEAKV